MAPGDRSALIADNSPRRLIADQGIMMAYAVDAVRSSLAKREELLFVIQNSGSTNLVLENLKTFEKLREGLNDLPIKFVILLSDMGFNTEFKRVYTKRQCYTGKQPRNKLGE